MTVTMNKLLLFYVMLIIIIIQCINSTVMSQLRYKRFQQKVVSEPKSHPIFPFMGKTIQKLNSVEICYATVGCFEIPRHHNPLQKIPENPESLQTEFYLYRRDINFSSPVILGYSDDVEILRTSKFDPKQPLKVIIHGYSTRWNEVGAIAGIKAYLDIYDCNAILVNWEKGARGPRYSNAAANTELVGRQLGLLLKNMIILGLQPQNIHLIGFSLGAHVAACASQMLKDSGMLIGRITGLDPASPLFKLNHFRDNRKKLDVTDAKYVDVVHTDGSPVFTDGFGLLEPLGHVDYFPNGGREQPGCTDIKASVIVSQFDKNLDREIACSHIRAYRYFLETLLMKASNSSGDCEFTAFSCPKGPQDFAKGKCFATNNQAGKLGENSTGKGPMYLVTRGMSPFCGTQMQVVMNIAPQTKRTKGTLLFNLSYKNYSSEFQINCDLTDSTPPKRNIYGLIAVDYNSLDKETTEISADLFYIRPQKPDNPRLPRHMIYVNRISITSMNGLSWQYCGLITIPQNINISIKLISDPC